MKQEKQKQERVDEMVALIQLWAHINSHSYNLDGIKSIVTKVHDAFMALKPDTIAIIPFANSVGLHLTKRLAAKTHIFLGGHLDTVYPPEHAFQKTTLVDTHILRGPGVTDMKGGIVVMLKALEAFEKKACAENVGWEIFLNADEEIGSPDSTPFFESCAGRCDVALLFEPCFPDGALVSERKGSANYTVISRGKAAHAGRDPHAGVNAIFPLVRWIHEAQALNGEGVLLNVGVIKGGEALNIVPDYAECGVNVRCNRIEDQQRIHAKLEQLARTHQLELIQTSYRPPKPFDAETEALFQELKRSAAEIGQHIHWKPSGGVCDGNTFAAKGVPTIDTLGVRGGSIHTADEFLDLNSLCEKVDLTTHFLTAIAEGKISLSRKRK